MTGRRRSGLQRVEAGLAARDRAILDDLARIRLATGRQLQRLHVAGGSPKTRARRTRSVLQRLTHLGLLTRLDRQVGGVHAGSSGYTYGLSATGQRLASGVGPAGGRRLRRPWNSSPGFADHLLQVTELYVQLREAERSDQHELLDFEAEPPCWRYWRGPNGERLVLKPDAYVRSAVGEIENLSFVEVDRATESTTVLRRKAETYVAYWRSGQEQTAAGVFPKVVWLVPDMKRLDQLTNVLGRLDSSVWRLFQVVLFEDGVAAITGRPPPGDREEGDN